MPTKIADFMSLPRSVLSVLISTSDVLLPLFFIISATASFTVVSATFSEGTSVVVSDLTSFFIIKAYI